MIIRTHPKNSGSALLILLTTAVVVSIVIGSALQMVANQNVSVARSQAWNTAMPVAEAGVEEAFTQLHHAGTNLSANGWSPSGSYYYKIRTLPNGHMYITLIQNLYPPVIYSWGYVPAPIKRNQLISRGIRIITQNSALYGKAIVSMTSVDLNGNNVEVDSFDSSTGSYSTGGRYDPSKRKDKGDVASVLGVANILNIGNANIRGSLHTGPGGSASVGNNGSVGDNAWVNAGTSGIKPGYFADDMNVSLPDVAEPFSGGAFTPTAGTVGGTSYNYVLTNSPPSTNYQLTSLSGTLYVKTNATLWVTTGSASLGGIVIASNAVLKLYYGTLNSNLNQSIGLAGNTTVNSDGRAIALQFFGLPSVKSITFSGNAGYTGTIYAPQADFTLNGSGSTTYDIVGSAIVRSVTMNGHFNFHYDESLAVSGPNELVISSWKEL